MIHLTIYSVASTLAFFFSPTKNSPRAISLSCSVAHSITHILSDSLPYHSLNHSVTQSLGQSVSQSLTHFILTHPLTHLLTHSLTLSINQLIAHPLVLTINHSLTLTQSLINPFSPVLSLWLIQWLSLCSPILSYNYDFTYEFFLCLTISHCKACTTKLASTYTRMLCCLLSNLLTQFFTNSTAQFIMHSLSHSLSLSLMLALSYIGLHSCTRQPGQAFKISLNLIPLHNYAALVVAFLLDF